VQESLLLLLLLLEWTTREVDFINHHIRLASRFFSATGIAVDR